MLEINEKDVWQRLKEDGIDFVMLHLGSRGYETGRLSLDESFVGNITAAQEADLMVGVVFSSQAIDVEEAVEEAEYVITNLIPYHITYPVAFEMKYAANDKSRIDNLTADEKSQIAEAFFSIPTGFKSTINPMKSRRQDFRSA